MDHEQKKDIMQRAARFARVVADYGCTPFREDGTPTPVREQLLQTAVELDALAASEQADPALELREVVGHIFFKYWDRLSDPVPEDSLEQITYELLQHLERDAMPLMRRPWEKDPARNRSLSGKPGNPESD